MTYVPQFFHVYIAIFDHWGTSLMYVEYIYAMDSTIYLFLKLKKETNFRDILQYTYAATPLFQTVLAGWWILELLCLNPLISFLEDLSGLM